ncbi:MAG: NAD(P)H-dependent oxidoreductase subunit E [Chloroflexi bacterium]|nr:NAD(P)H-dependent oxidoreductase subunit E [Chloroflexota bacterium]
MLSDQVKDGIRTLMAKYPDKRSAVMPALHLAQHQIGWLPDEAIADVADVIGLSKTEVGSVASFYTMYAREKPGEHTVFFCTDLPCALRGAEEMMEHIEHRLGCKAGQTSPDGKVTLREAECLGGCDHGPAMLVDGVEHEQDLTNDKVDEILDRLTKK